MRHRADVPEVADPARVQVVRREDHPGLRAGDHGHRRPKWLRQIQRGRRHRLGARRAGAEIAARRQDAGRHLRRHGQPRRPRPGRGRPHHRQLGRAAADRVHRGDGHPAAVPLRGERVRHQRHPLPAARHPGAAVGHRRRPRAAHRARPEPPRGRPPGPPRGPPGGHRGGGRRLQAPPPQGEGAAQAGRHGAAPGQAVRPGRASCAASSSRCSSRPRPRPGRPRSRPSCARSG